ncbi:HAD-IA family hydrolase, partial [bacterium]|nr:HAD-IA family hydrolase [bacterium]MBU1916737.1 HAD-IA family hydrolase [bacterium]
VLLREQGASLNDLSEEQLNDFYGKRAVDIVDLIYESVPTLTMSKTVYYQRRHALFLDLASTRLEPMPGFEPFILQMQNCHYKLALATSGTREYVNLFIEKYSLHDIFSVIVTGNDVSQGKPHPDVYLRAAEKLKALPEECLVLEDATHGVVAAKDAGMICVAIRNPFVKNPLDLSLADCIVNSLSEITEEFIRRIL